ncbi:MAG: J domain-containing protein [Alphaproteobacteria bacterium]|nr:MAG: J domain-containing protein [Alphaproteobacteria bacterium]
MNDLYKILGVEKSASQDQIKKAYRELAKKLHPDRNKDDVKVADRFKEVSAAYSILGDEAQRKRYDRGDIDENGAERGPGAGGFGGFRSSRSAGGERRTSFDFDEAEDLFSDFFRFTGRRGTAGGKSHSGDRGDARSNPFEGSGRKKGLDISYQITIGFEESITGGKRRLHLNDGRDVDIKVPEGIQNGQVIRLAGQGGPGFGGAPKGDALIEVEVSPHPYFKRVGNDIHLELPISLDEAVLGGDIDVPTPKGRLTVRIPRGSSTGRRLRLKDKGVKRGSEVGHMYVSLKVMLPDDRDADLEELIKQWGRHDGAKMRRKAGLT